MSQHKWPTQPTLQPMACLRGCGTTRQKYDARRWFYQTPGTMGGMRAPMCMPWSERMAREVAPHVNGYTIVVRDNSGVVRVGNSYMDRRAAFTQRTRLANEAEINVYVATRDGDHVKVYSSMTTRLIAVDLAV